MTSKLFYRPLAQVSGDDSHDLEKKVGKMWVLVVLCGFMGEVLLVFVLCYMFRILVGRFIFHSRVDCRLGSRIL